MECGVLLCGRRFLLSLKGAVHNCYVRPAIIIIITIMYEGETWCHK